MNLNVSFSFVTALILFFIIQVMNETHRFLVEGGIVNGVVDQNYFQSSLIIIPFCLLIVGIVQTYLYLKKKNN